MGIGSRMRLVRERKGWTQTFVAQKLGIPNSTLSGYERGYRIPDANMIKAIAEVLEVSPDYLLGYKADHDQQTDDVEKDLEMRLREGDITYKGVPLSEEQCEILADFLEAVVKRSKKNALNRAAV